MTTPTIATTDASTPTSPGAPDVSKMTTKEYSDYIVAADAHHEANQRGAAEALTAPARAARAAPATPAQPTTADAATKASGLADINPRQQAYADVIDAMVTAGADRSPATAPRMADMILDVGGDEDNLQITRAAPALPEGSAAPALNDSEGLDPRGEANAIIANVTRMEAELAERSNTFDPVTGERAFVRTGAQRAALEAQLRQAKISGAYQIERLNALIAQRGSQTAPVQSSNEAALLEAATRMAYIDSAPPGQRQEYAARYDKMIADAKAQALTAAVVRASAAGRR